MSATFHGRYRVEGELTGKPATTAAIDTETERKVAVRTFERTDDAAALDRFRRAVDALRSLDHPGIARVLAAGVEDGTPFVVLELDRWKPLEVWVSQRKRLPEGQALAVVAELARAVSFAHAHAKMLAIDLSPENVALVQDEQAGARPVLGTGDLVGTSRSRAPELKGAEPGRTDERALVFDLGALLFFCLTGALPAEAGIALPEGTSPPIATVLGAALRAIPEERPGTVSAFGELCEVARARLRATIRRMPDEVERE